ncbi:MAG: WD40 repeat domain-containing protein [Bacteroidia bacterium]
MPITVSQIQAYTGHRGSIFAMTHDPEEQFLFTSGDDGVVAQWNLAQGKDEASALLQIPHAVYGLAYVAPHDLLVAGASEGTISFVDVSSRELRKQYARTRDAIYHIEYVAATDSLWILHGSGYLSIVDAKTLEERSFKRISTEHLRSLAIHQGTAYIACSDHHIIALDVKDATEITRWKAHDNSVFSVLVHPSGQYLFSGGRDAHLCVWDLKRNHEQIARIPAHNFTINDLALSSDEQHLLTASRDKTFKLWDAHTFKLLKVVDHARNEAHTHSVNRIFWLAKDNSVISCSDDRKILRWKVLIS